MSDELLFFTHPMSRGRIVRWMLEEVGEPYRTEVLDYAAGMKEPAYLAINPMGKVPAIRHGETVVTEVAAICTYLADAFPRSGLAPAPDSRERGPYYRWLFFAAGPIEAAVTNKALGVVVPPERKRMAGYGSLDDVLATLNDALKRHTFLAGTAFSAADLVVGSQLAFGMMFGTIGKRPSFEDYVGRIGARPAAVRARALDDALLPSTKPTGPQPDGATA